MKLRFRNNSLRLRLNRREVASLASGIALEEQICFPGNSRFSYVLERSAQSSPQAWFREGVIGVSAPEKHVRNWAESDSIGLYFEVPAGGKFLNISIEKDLECLDAPPEERDPDTFSRIPGKNC